MRLSDIMANLPPVKEEIGAREKIRTKLKESSKRLVVVDDDPTGTQTVHGVKVYMDWSVKELRKALGTGGSVFYISTNSRSLNPEEARELNYALGKNLKESSRMEGKDVLLASRSDSTLRGHFPDEVQALKDGFGERFDGIIIAPCFFEAGRYTIDDIHWVEQGGEVISAEKTEFAKDPTFGYKHGNLRYWVEEKTKGKVNASDVYSVSIEVIRKGGPDAVTEELLKVSNGRPVIVNATCYEDLEVFVLGLIAAEECGKEFIYRCAASFVKVRGGFEDIPLLSYEQLKPDEGPGLVIVGSYVEKTTRQLKALLQSGLVSSIELSVSKLLDKNEHDKEIQRVKEEADNQMAKGNSIAIYTSRDIVKRDDFLETGKVIMTSLCDMVKRIRLKPGFVIAKGGITSIEIAKRALGVSNAEVMGQIAGGVPVWRLGSESRWDEIPYVVFPGNVGDDKTLADVVLILKGMVKDGK